MADRRGTVLVIDNYDSFVYNIVQYLQQLGATVEVARNDQVTAEQAETYAGVLLSPGPGTPERAGVCIDVIRRLGPAGVPVFGVCLGLQAMAVAYGGVVDRADKLMHGKTCEVLHEGTGVFEGLPSPLIATRYHSLAAMPDSLPASLERTAWTADGVIMGFRHRSEPVEGVQFHPESVMTQYGHKMFARWLDRCGVSGALQAAQDLVPAIR